MGCCLEVMEFVYLLCCEIMLQNHWSYPQYFATGLAFVLE